MESPKNFWRTKDFLSSQIQLAFTMWWILATGFAMVAGYWIFIRPHKYWLEKGVKQGNPKFIVGDNWGMLMKKQSFADLVEMVYNMFPKTRYSGFYQFLTPTLVIRDPDLIKQITVKDFDHFMDHRTFIPEGADPLWNNNLVALTGKKWKKMRGTLSPTFTSSKMKYMFSLISQSGERFVKHFLEKKEDIITLEMKDTFARFTNDVIANTAFGIECDSLRDRKNEFYLMADEVTDLSGFRKNMKMFSFLLMPGISKFIGLKMFSTVVADFFYNLVISNIRSREKQGIVRPDMIHLLLDAKKHGWKHEEVQSVKDTGFATAEESEINKIQPNGKTEITDEDITSQAIIFLFAGFDSVSSLMCFMSYELALNPNVQERLTEEVEETAAACDGKLTYEALLSMKYMDMVVSETLRKWPIAVAADRICTKPYTIEPKLSDEKPLHLEKNTALWLPIFGLHRDPQYYPEPERFDPERFSEENKANIKPYTYLPFGSGPRNCIGSRFALLETKILFFYILSQFEIVPIEKTQIPLVIETKVFVNISAENGFWLGLKRRRPS